MLKTLLMAICLIFMITVFGCLKQGGSNSADYKAASFTVADLNDNVVIAYYFHKNIRCATCLKIESSAKRVIEDSFPQQIAEKKLIWVPFNLDEPGGKEFEEKYNVSSSTLVLAKLKSNGDTQYLKLEKTWELISNQDDFDAYVRNEVQQFLNE